MSVLVLDEHQVRSLLTMDECIEAMEEVLRSLARGELHQPLRPVTRPEDSDTLMGLMPAYRGGERPAWSLKEIVIAPATRPVGWTRTRRSPPPRRRDGRCARLLNASAITEIRTAAVSGVATRALARPGAGRRNPRRRRPGTLAHRGDALGAPRGRDSHVDAARRRHARGRAPRGGRRLHVHERP